MKYSYNYNTELENILNEIYKNKIYNIAAKNNISKIDDTNLSNIINIFTSTHVYLGSDLDDFIISLMPTGDAGYFYRVEISKHFNHSYPRLFDYLGNPIKSESSNKFALKLWQSNTEKMFIEDIHSKFSKENFYSFVKRNLLIMADDITSFINKLNKEKEIIIPISDKSELLSNVKSMILDNKLDSSWVELLVDIDELRSNMQKYSAEFDIYSEFDKLEDDLEECLNQFCKYTSEDLYECLINEKGFNFIENVGLVKR
ncbi:MAG: hypothetical protein E7E21_04215 [Peptostreptococcaceae bacterium]|nr:hypothetical protein [Peptostreptococcaceae bacterium]